MLKILTVGDYGIPMESFINLLRMPTGLKGFRALGPNVFVHNLHESNRKILGFGSWEKHPLNVKGKDVFYSHILDNSFRFVLSEATSEHQEGFGRLGKGWQEAWKHMRMKKKLGVSPKSACDWTSVIVSCILCGSFEWGWPLLPSPSLDEN